MGDIEQRQQGEDDGAVVRVVSRIDDIPAAEWDACARGEDSSGKTGRPANPFISHAFFHALEESGSADRESGWMPQHLVLEDAAGGIAACMPCYLKSHSYGEYVFDHAWADAYRARRRPLLSEAAGSVPFTPVTGPRLLASRSAERDASLLAGCGAALTERRDVLRCTSLSCRRKSGRLLGSARLAPAHRHPVPLAQPGLCGLRRFPGRPLLAQAQEHPQASAKRSRRRASRFEWVTGSRHHRSALGRVLRLLHGHRLAQMGHALSHARDFSA